MAEDSHIIPLATPGDRKSDQELNLSKAINFYKHDRKKRSSKCFVFILSTIVSVSIVLLIFSMIFFRFKAPSFELSLINVKNLRYTTTPLPSFNMTMGVEIFVDNENFGKINFQDSSMSVFLYDNVTIGFMNINVGRVEARKTKRMGITLQVGANDQLPHTNGNLSSDINSRLVKLRSFAKFRGKVKAMNIASSHKTSVLNCTMNLNLTSQAIQDLLCS